MLRLLSVLSLLIHCEPAPRSTVAVRAARGPADRDARVEAPASSALLASLESDEETVSLAVSGFGDAVLSLPIGAREPRPVVMVVHGSLDRPEWQCASWRRILNDRAFVLCLRGALVRSTRRWQQPRYTFEGEAALRSEAIAALAALRARYGAYVGQPPGESASSARGAVIFAGFSLGAMMAPEVCATNALRCSHLVLTEGGVRSWPTGGVRAFNRRGGRAVLFACGQLGCVRQVQARLATLRRHGLRAEITFGPRTGHHYIGNVERAIKAALPWLLGAAP